MCVSTDPESLKTLNNTDSKEKKEKCGFRYYCHKLSCCCSYVRYFHDWENWIKLVLILLAIIFASAFNTDCLCAHRWQWQIGTLAVFLTWADFIIFIQKFPMFGIYVVMLVDIFVTFIKAVPTIMMLVLGFSFGFFMLFHQPGTLVSFPSYRCTEFLCIQQTLSQLYYHFLILLNYEFSFSLCFNTIRLSFVLLWCTADVTTT